MWKPNTPGQKRLLEALADTSPSGITSVEWVKLAREECRMYLFERGLVELVDNGHVVLTTDGEEAWSSGHHWDRFATRR